MIPVLQRKLAVLCAWSAAACLLGAWVARGVSVTGAAQDPTVPRATNFYLYTFEHYEPLALYGGLGIFIALHLIALQKSGAEKFFGVLSSPRLPLFAAGLVLLVLGVGRFAIYQNFDLCIDEYLNNFEVSILDRYQLRADVPSEWQPYEGAMRVAFQQYRADSGQWASGFLPGFASLQWLFAQGSLDWAVSPLLAMTSVLLLAAVARRIFPTHTSLAGNVAVLLLATSPQFLAMGMTKFAWTAHLSGTLLWVWLLTHPRQILFLLTPVLGALLIGLHQPHVHPLIAAPFVMRFLYTRQWKIFAWFTAWYLLGAIAWYQVYVALRPHALAGGGDLANMSASFSLLPFLVSAIFATCHAITLLAWIAPLAVPLAGLFIMTWKDQPAVARDGVIAVGLTFAFYFFFPHPQGHGWGFRYLHATYPLLMLAAAAGGLQLLREEQGARLARLLVASLLFSLVLQLPYRALELRQLVRPLAETSRFISRQKADFVLVRTSDFWYAADLIRNDPWLEKRPLIFALDKLTPDQIAALKQRGSVITVGAAEVERFGVILSDPKKTPAP